tara:strand:+ start:2449 stop:2940 length:492 start_codon:yes stop_codon:yes gene_type:complete
MNTRSSLCSLAPDAPLRSALDAARPRPASSASASAKAARVRKRPTVASRVSSSVERARENKSASILFARAAPETRARAHRIESNHASHPSSIIDPFRARERASARARERTLEIRDGGIVIRRATHGERATRDGATRARLRLDRPGMRARDARGGGFGHVVLYT